MLIVTRHHDISAGHRVFGHEGKCKSLHGHNYRIHFTVAGQAPDEVGRVIDFSIIKSKLCNWLEEEWDHKMLIWVNDDDFNKLQLNFGESSEHEFLNNSIVVVPFNPTAEEMAKYLVDVIGPMQLMGTGCVLAECKVEETRKCSATYFHPAFYPFDEYAINMAFANAKPREVKADDGPFGYNDLPF